MNIAEQIDALEAALSTGSKSVTVGDKNIVYRDFDEILKILNLLKGKTDDRMPSGGLNTTYISYSKGL